MVTCNCENSEFGWQGQNSPPCPDFAVSQKNGFSKPFFQTRLVLLEKVSRAKAERASRNICAPQI